MSDRLGEKVDWSPSRYSTKFRYVCECGPVIYGESWDIQESPKIACPECGSEMDIELEWEDD